MFMSEDYQCIYPKFAKFIYEEIPKIRGREDILSLMVLSATEPNKLKRRANSVGLRFLLQSALAFGTYPELIPSMTTPSGDIKENEAGAFDAKTPRAIYLKSSILWYFEKDFNESPAQRFMLATVLHEIVHYLDYQIDQNLQVPRSEKELDLGDIFEILAYGSRVPMWERVNE